MSGNFPAPREIPAGKILLAEYGEYGPEERAQVEILAQAYSAHCSIRGNVRLVFSSPGFECAGSMAHWTNGYWAVQFYSGGAITGRRYLPTDDGEDQARAHFAKLTTDA